MPRGKIYYKILEDRVGFSSYVRLPQGKTLILICINIYKYIYTLCIYYVYII